MKRSPRSIVSAALIAAGLGLSAVAVAGLAITASASPITGVVMQGVDASGERMPQPTASATELGNGGAAAAAADDHEDELDRSIDPRVANSRAVIDTDRERAAFAELLNACMADAGFAWWDAARADVSTGNARVSWWVEGRSLVELEEIYAALYGANTSAEYDWKDAGCYGAALHETGNDDNH